MPWWQTMLNHTCHQVSTFLVNPFLLLCSFAQRYLCVKWYTFIADTWCLCLEWRCTSCASCVWEHMRTILVREQETDTGTAMMIMKPSLILRVRWVLGFSCCSSLLPSWYFFLVNNSLPSPWTGFSLPFSFSDGSFILRLNCVEKERRGTSMSLVKGQSGQGLITFSD